MRDLGTALPGSLRDGCLPVGERGAGGGVAGILVEGEDAVLARELVVSECRVVCRTGGQAQAADLGAGGWVLDGEGVGVGVHASLPLGGPEGLGCVRSRAVIVGEGCDGAVGGAFSDFFLGCRPQDGRVIGGFGSGNGRRGCQPEHGGREYRGSEGCDDRSIPHESNSFVSMGARAGIRRRASVDPQNLTRVSFCDVSSFRAVKHPRGQRAREDDIRTSVHRPRCRGRRTSG